jgi:hypothetical protein
MMESERIERYTINYPEDVDEVVIEMSQRLSSPYVGTLSVALFGLSQMALLRWPTLGQGSLGFLFWSSFLLVLSTICVLIGLFVQRWTISRDAIVYSSSFRKRPRTLEVRDLAGLKVHEDPGNAGPDGGAILPFEIDFLPKKGAVNVPPSFQFWRRHAFGEFLTILHEALPIPIDDSDGLCCKIKKPNVDALA